MPGVRVDGNIHGDRGGGKAVSGGVQEVATCRGRDTSCLEYFLSEPSLPVKGTAASWEN